MAEISVHSVRETVRQKYREVVRSGAARFAYRTGRAGALALGYDAALLDAMNPEALETYCGVGNPFELGPLAAGEAVLDIGCGAGVDVIIAAHLVGPRGRVCGIDLTSEMVDLASGNVTRLGLRHANVAFGTSEAIPFDDESFDVVISNGVLNLSPLKEQSYREIHRVLRPGGRLQFADIVLTADLHAEAAGSLDAWSD